MALPEVTQEPIIHVNATPDEGYPLRILRAYRENCNREWVSETDKPLNPLLEQMNKYCRQRAVILDAAIAVLEAAQ